MKALTAPIRSLILSTAVSLTLIASPLTQAQTVTETVTPAAGAMQTAAVQNQQQAVININSADLTQLQELKGIGPAKAQRILDFRNQHGAFKSVEALTQIKGISLRILEQNKGRIEI